MNTIYILQLEHNKYYVGKTKNINKRILNHFANNGSEWTKKYKPIEIIDTFKSNDIFDEEKHTLLNMDKYGIDNVRGGSYSKIELSELEKDKIKQILNSINDRCYKCNTKGHFTNECDKIQLLNDPNKLEEYIRKKLGQIIFPTPKCEECDELCDACKKKLICVNTKCSNFYDKWKMDGHRRFEFDAQDDNLCKENNKKIIELFDEFYKDKRCIVHSHEGSIWFQIVLLHNYLKYDYYSIKDDYVNDNLPYHVIFDYSGTGTVDILKDLIIKIYNNDYNENSLCSVEIINNDI
jgi:hypothetical protein